MTNEEITLALQYLIGSRYVPTVKAYIGELTGRTRIVGPRDGSDRMRDNKRVHIAVDAAGLISDFKYH
ncbi:hypothetical protein [Pseudomonas viridiflava]|uniref:hypothetical protein n=1 Tax=Pseudomonas syringae group TaxID=136849 RepID=UPI0004080ADF|nr:hypothetical protein [Pseudomonas viridiflava]QXG37792.1 hypothetical protein KTT61_11640 [Pseudomonas viridiflava]QXG40959.1 hypothetical protein KTT55_00110 [Pseudomonas viridiflava]